MVSNSAAGVSLPVSSPVPAPEPSRDTANPQRTAVAQRPTVIVPSPRRNEAVAESPLSDRYDYGERVPHLVELPLSFQRQVPSLIFNSHIYASDPSGRRVMINNHYLRIGDSFSGIRVERITEEGVELSLHGRQFRVGVVRDWVSPR
ncbi:general secretion pathway protein GspB [Marinobacter sp. SS21]|uniref:general secretion pathway protein GspB n=1 Tax=Marinobacter sp. SS21 TaxID=2979460 RepID=UPI002FEE3B9E